MVNYDVDISIISLLCQRAEVKVKDEYGERGCVSCRGRVWGFKDGSCARLGSRVWWYDDDRKIHAVTRTLYAVRRTLYAVRRTLYDIHFTSYCSELG